MRYILAYLLISLSFYSFSQTAEYNFFKPSVKKVYNDKGKIEKTLFEESFGFTFVSDSVVVFSGMGSKFAIATIGVEKGEISYYMNYEKHKRDGVIYYFSLYDEILLELVIVNHAENHYVYTLTVFNGDKKTMSISGEFLLITVD